ncbi:MAG: hypothetical protein IJD58_02215 [Lachnospiraceae bacterium]|nr:hypothetical protein [Lachnospiraceae bacterium]
MKNITQYELKMFSSNLVESPQIVFDGMDIVIELKGYDDIDEYHECRIKFDSVIGLQYALAGFSITLNAYDKIIEIEDSEWIEQYKNVNEEESSYWKPKHYVIYLDEVGLYQFLAQSFNVEER